MNRSSGFLHLVFPAMLALVALTFLLSGRDFSVVVTDMAGAVADDPVRHPAVVWAQRGVSLLILAASAERIFSQITRNKPVPSLVLVWTFFGYWFTSVAATALFSAHPQMSHEYLYALAVGMAAALAVPVERDKVLDASRNALIVFMLACVALIPVMPNLVLHSNYAQGFIPGLPRLTGLASHSVALGMLAQIGLLLLWTRPFSSRWVNRLAWLLSIVVLFLSQAKTAWIAFLICTVVMLVIRQGSSFSRRIGDAKGQSFGVVTCLGFIAVVLMVLAALLVGDIQTEVAGFFDTSEGEQLLSLTGRDRIWAIAIEEWKSNPLFGYGHSLWDAEFRTSIGMANATNAHNQFMDTLARSGSVGAVGLVLYAVALLALSIRYAKATGGLSLALFLSMALRAISEVPMALVGYGVELFTHLLLIVTLAAAAASRRPVAPIATGGRQFGVTP